MRKEVLASSDDFKTDPDNSVRDKPDQLMIDKLLIADKPVISDKPWVFGSVCDIANVV